MKKLIVATLLPVLILPLVIVLMVIPAIIDSLNPFSGGSGGTSASAVTRGLPPEVEMWRPLVAEYAEQYEIPEMVDVLLAMIMVESRGTASDVMQSSESAGLPPNTLGPRESIRQGVGFFSSLLNRTRGKDLHDDVAIQAYNFGGAFITWVYREGGEFDIPMAMRFSREVVAPSLGNTTGRRYTYNNPVANNYGNFLYWNGGNFFYFRLVRSHLSSPSAEVQGGRIAILDAQLGRRVFNGQCYGITAYYVYRLGGPTMMGSGNLYAWRIGTFYNWEAFGWSVILNPVLEDVQPGDVINMAPGGFAPSRFGHTGIVATVNHSTGIMELYEQNVTAEITNLYTRTWGVDFPNITSIVRPPSN